MIGDLRESNRFIAAIVELDGDIHQVIACRTEDFSLIEQKVKKDYPYATVYKMPLTVGQNVGLIDIDEYCWQEAV